MCFLYELRFNEHVRTINFKNSYANSIYFLLQKTELIKTS